MIERFQKNCYAYTGAFKKKLNIVKKLTTDLAMVQKTIIDTLHKEGKSHKVITERGGCSHSAVSKHIKCKDWKKEIYIMNKLFSHIFKCL